ncbi:helix-turn-helix domain-containing protein [Methanosphaera sp.]
MQNETIDILEGMYLENISRYVTLKEIPEGKEILINNFHLYTISLKFYDILPGLTIITDDKEIEERYPHEKDLLQFKNPDDLLAISYITRGSCQMPVENNKFIFINGGNMNMYIKGNNPRAYEFIKHSTFTHLVFDKKVFHENKTSSLEPYEEILDKLFNLSKENQNLVFKASDEIIQVIEQMKQFETLSKNSCKEYLRLKVFELILLLDNVEIKDIKDKQRTYSDAQIRVVRKIKNDLSRNIASYISLDSLAISYGINLTTLKNCFRDMYEKPLYTWYREYKFHRAKELIQNTTYPISKIANMIGYKSSSKFAKAFKKEMGVLPSSYREKKK